MPPDYDQRLAEYKRKRDYGSDGERNYRGYDVDPRNSRSTNMDIAGLSGGDGALGGIADLYGQDGIEPPAYTDAKRGLTDQGYSEFGANESAINGAVMGLADLLGGDQGAMDQAYSVVEQLMADRAYQDQGGPQRPVPQGLPPAPGLQEPSPKGNVFNMLQGLGIGRKSGGG